MPRPPIELSYTRMKELRCPFRYQQLYLNGIEEPDSEAAHMGTVLHMWAARYGLHLVQRKRYSDHDWFIAYVQDQVQAEPYYLREQMLETAAKFMECFTLDKSADSHHFERRLAVLRAGHTPCDIAEPVDKIAGTLDHVAVYNGGREVTITDYKMGFRFIEFDEVQVDPQLKLYAWLWMMTHPACQKADVELWAPRWGARNKSVGCFTREMASAAVEDWIAASWTVIEHYVAELGTTPWPTSPNWDTCRWCQLACPQYLANLKTYQEAVNG